MAKNFFSKKNVNFLLYDVHDVESLTGHSYFADHNKETFDMTIDSATQIAENLMFPFLKDVDKNQPELKDGKVVVHPSIKNYLKAVGESGIIGADFDYENGGAQMPVTITSAVGYILMSANNGMMYTGLTAGGARLIASFGSEDLKQQYVENMITGKWQGTMCLTEPQAGSSLSDITSSAEPLEDGTYKIRGQKVFISAGDHDATDNIIHLFLARIKGAPKGTKGISLFVVPRQRVATDGTLVTNDVATAGVYHKMGYKGAPIAHLMMGSNNDCEGYLVGEPHKGLSYMFQMMNEARIGVGINATAIGTAAYYESLAYAKERPQGRKISEKDPTQPQTPIINHADVKRMLLFQKAVTEGALSLLLYCSQLADVAHVEEGEAKERAQLLLDLLTPIAKSYPSEMCCLSTSAAVQILGGAGYTTDFPVEQYYREARIHPIHEGTTAIHGLDLLGRKISIHQGKAAQLFFEELTETINKALIVEELKPLAEQLQKTLGKAQQVTRYLLSMAGKGEIEKYLSDATLYLELFGIITIGWHWLRQATIAQQRFLEAHDADKDFYQGKLMTARYFYEYELVKADSLMKRLLSADHVTIDMQTEWF